MIKKILIIAPHSDDELIGCGGLLLKSAEDKVNVKIVYLTNGYTKEEPKRKGDLRKNAIRVVLKSLNIPKSNLIFLNYYERNIDKSNIKVVYFRLKKIVTNFVPHEIYVPAYEGGHIDHDIANFLISKLINKDMIVYEYKMYNNYYYPSKLIQIFIRELIKKLTKSYFFGDTSIFIPVKNLKPFKLKMTEIELKTKNSLIEKYKEIAEKPLDKKEPRTLLRPYKEDHFRLLPKYNYKKAPHKRIILPLNYELAFKIPFKKFLETVDYLNKNI